MDVEYPRGCQPIVPSHGNHELVRRLRVLSTALQDTAGQDEDCSLGNLAVHLAQPRLMESGSREVRALLAACIADLFRISAPETPYTDPAQLQSVLTFLIKTLRGLDNPKDPLYHRYYHVLDNLTCSKAMNLVHELGDEAPHVLRELIHNSVMVVKSSEDSDDKVQSVLTEMVCTLIQHMDQITPTVLDVLFYFIVNPQKTQNPKCYSMTCQILQRCQTALEPFIQNYFNRIFLTDSMPESKLIPFEKRYDVVYELYDVMPDVLHSVLPQMEHKFETNNEKDRSMAVDLFGRLCRKGQSSVADEYPALWTRFLARFNDIERKVRVSCIEHAQHLLLQQPSLRGQVSEALASRSRDVDETVRLAFVSCVGYAAKRKLESVNDILFDMLADRVRDKKFKVRQQAMLNLGTLYRRVMFSNEYSHSEKKSLEWVPDKILPVYLLTDMEDRLLVERILHSCLIPFAIETSKRAKAMFDVYTTSNDETVRMFDRIFRGQNSLRIIVRNLMELHQSEESSERDTEIENTLHKIGEAMGESVRGVEALKKFYGMISTDQRAFKLMEYVVGTSYTTKKVEDAIKELLNKCDSDKVVKTLLERIGPLLIDAETVNCLLDLIQSVNSGTLIVDEVAFKRIYQLLRLISECFPYTFKSEKTLKKLLDFIKADNDEYGVQLLLEVFAYIGPDTESEFNDTYGELIPQLCKIATDGSPKQSKLAVRCINKVAKEDEKSALWRQIYNEVVPNVDMANSKATTALTCLGQLASVAASHFGEELRDLIRGKVVSTIILKDEVHSLNDSLKTKKWLEVEQLSSQCSAKRAAMKLLSLYGRAVKSSESTLVGKMLKLYSAVISARGDIHENANICEAEKGQLRLRAGTCLLRLAEERTFLPLIQLDQYQNVAELIRDPVREVRDKFAAHLYKGLLRMRLPVEYMSIFSLVGLLDPVEQLQTRTRVRNLLLSVIKNTRDTLRRSVQLQSHTAYFLPEYSIGYAVHLLAHIKEFKTTEDLDFLFRLKECLWYFMEPFNATKDMVNNFDFIYRILQDVKDSQDVQKPDVSSCSAQEQNEKMWVLADIGMLLTVYRVNFVLKDNPGRAILSDRFFLKTDKSNTAIYVPDLVQQDEIKRSGKQQRQMKAVGKKKGTGENEKRNVDRNTKSKVVKSVLSKKGKKTKPKRKSLVSKTKTKRKILTSSPKKIVSSEDSGSRNRDDQKTPSDKEDKEAESESDISETENGKSENNSQSSAKSSRRPISSSDSEEKKVKVSKSSERQSSRLIDAATGAVEKKAGRPAKTTNNASSPKKRKMASARAATPSRKQPRRTAKNI